MSRAVRPELKGGNKAPVDASCYRIATEAALSGQTNEQVVVCEVSRSPNEDGDENRLNENDRQYEFPSPTPPSRIRQ